MTLIPQPSRQWFVLLMLIHVGALCCLLLSGAPGWVMMLAGLACVYSLIISLRHAALLASTAVLRVSVTEDGQWRLQNRAGSVMAAKLRGDSLVSRFLVILNFKLETKRRNISVILLSDSVDAHTFRRLKQYLLTQRYPKPLN
jgi:toxin CptA